MEPHNTDYHQALEGNAWANKTIFRQLGGLRCKSHFEFFISLVKSFVAWENLREEDYFVKLSNNNMRLRANLLTSIIKTTKAIYDLYKMSGA